MVLRTIRDTDSAIRWMVARLRSKEGCSSSGAGRAIARARARGPMVATTGRRRRIRLRWRSTSRVSIRRRVDDLGGFHPRCSRRSQTTPKSQMRPSRQARDVTLTGITDPSFSGPRLNSGIVPPGSPDDGWKGIEVVAAAEIEHRHLEELLATVSTQHRRLLVHIGNALVVVQVEGVRRHVRHLPEQRDVEGGGNLASRWARRFAWVRLQAARRYQAQLHHRGRWLLSSAVVASGMTTTRPPSRGAGSSGW
jgi:hypothetical protein